MQTCFFNISSFPNATTSENPMFFILSISAFSNSNVYKIKCCSNISAFPHANMIKSNCFLNISSFPNANMYENPPFFMLNISAFSNSNFYKINIYACTCMHRGAPVYACTFFFVLFCFACVCVCVCVCVFCKLF